MKIREIVSTPQMEEWSRRQRSKFKADVKSPCQISVAWQPCSWEEDLAQAIHQRELIELGEQLRRQNGIRK